LERNARLAQNSDRSPVASGLNERSYVDLPSDDKSPTTSVRGRDPDGQAPSRVRELHSAIEGPVQVFESGCEFVEIGTEAEEVARPRGRHRVE
jgi:hypothetical protein